jgi:hypothetical protein
MAELKQRKCKACKTPFTPADDLKAIRDLYRAKLRELVKERANG